MDTHITGTGHLIGRTNELAAVRHILTTARLVTLTGSGGSGKTTIARRTTSDLRRQLRGNGWFVELGNVAEPSLLGYAVALSLGLHPDATDSQAPLIASFIGDREALLTFDNCEHLTEAVIGLAVDVLTRCPNLRVLATSRHALGVGAERTFAVPPLSAPAIPDTTTNLSGPSRAAPRSPAQALEFESVRLFVERAKVVQPDFVLSDRNADAVARLCGALEGIPLSIELAAARIRVLTPQAMLERLDDRYRLLNRGAPGVPVRQQSLTASMDWSHELCTPDERLLWARLSVFIGGFDLETAEAVCSDERLAAGDVLDLIASLLDKSILSRVPDEVHVHFTMLETIRQYGARRLDDLGETGELQAQHRAWFLSLSARCGAEWNGPDQADWVGRMARNLPNLRTTLEIASGLPQEAPGVLRAVVDLETYWVAAGLLSEARRWSLRALAHGTGTGDERAMGLAVAAYFASVQMNLEEASTLLAEEKPLAEASVDLTVKAYHELALAMNLLFSGDVMGAIPGCQRAASLFADAGRTRPEATARVTLGVMYFYAAEIERCQDHLTEFLDWLPEGELYFSGFAYWILASAALAGGDPGRATELIRHGIRADAGLSNQLGLAWTFETVAAIAAADGEAERSAIMLGAAQAIWVRVGETSLSAPYITAQRELGEAMARGTLHDNAFQAAYRHGQSLSQDEAIAVSLSDPRQAGASTVRRSAVKLTARETQVAALLGEGLSNRDIADRLYISLRTAQGHVESILRKLGFNSRTQVAAWVARGGDNGRHLRAVNGS